MIKILGLLGMCFDAVEVKVNTLKAHAGEWARMRSLVILVVNKSVIFLLEGRKFWKFLQIVPKIAVHVELRFDIKVFCKYVKNSGPSI